jgi:spermidine synthase
MGARNIDAVEIDPVFPEIGRKFHKQAPYDGKNVMLHIEDARTYFKRCEKRYDLIVYGTLA